MVAAGTTVSLPKPRNGTKNRPACHHSSRPEQAVIPRLLLCPILIDTYDPLSLEDGSSDQMALLSKVPELVVVVYA